MRLNDSRRRIRTDRVVGKVRPAPPGKTEELAFTRTARRRALFSPCGRYRYLLEIVDNQLLALRSARPTAVGAQRPVEHALLGIIGLNPSTATELVDDPTIRREKAFARSWGYLGIRKVNLAAFRAKYPHDMLAVPDPIGPENTVDFIVEQLLQDGADSTVLAAWGSNGAHPKLAPFATALRERLGERLIAFGLTHNGQPMHPLYLPADMHPRPLLGLQP